MNSFETPSSPLNSERIQEIRTLFAHELEELATAPDAKLFPEEQALVDAFVNKAGRLPENHRLFRGMLVRLGQDLRLTHEEIDALKEAFLE